MKESRVKQRLGSFFTEITRQNFVLYICKCLLGLIICYFLYIIIPGHQLQWSIISALLVLAPEGKDSIALSVARMKANIIGASVGLAVFLLTLSQFVALGLGVVATILICTFFKLGVAMRSALAALIIVLINDDGGNKWQLGVDRMMSVIAGCLIAMGITYLFMFMQRKQEI